MDYVKIGKLIRDLRQSKGMTQKQLADTLNISDKTISKWERAMGCPDVSLLNKLSEALGVNIDKILDGDMTLNDADGGNMKRTKFYVCSMCGNILTGISEADISCCGRKLMPLEAKKPDAAHELTIEEIEDDYYITFSHEMSKAHYISFVANITINTALIVKLYPEQGSEARFPKLHDGKLYYYCSQDGLFVSD